MNVPLVLVADLSYAQRNVEQARVGDAASVVVASRRDRALREEAAATSFLSE